MNRVFVALTVLLACPAALLAQEPQQQLRLAWHPTAQVSSHWFVAGWVIGNLKAGSPDNINFLAGLGIKHDSSRLEGMVWRQVSSAGNQWSVDFRFTQTFKHGLVYAEIAPSLTKTAAYNLVFVERQLIGRLSIGAETENTFQVGPDSLGGGPHATWLLAKTAHFKLTVTYSYQVRRTGKDWSRIWLVVSTSR